MLVNKNVQNELNISINRRYRRDGIEAETETETEKVTLSLLSFYCHFHMRCATDTRIHTHTHSQIEVEWSGHNTHIEYGFMMAFIDFITCARTNKCCCAGYCMFNIEWTRVCIAADYVTRYHSWGFIISIPLLLLFSNNFNNNIVRILYLQL